ncbi:MAG: HRDC domain-containing protein, partial [Sporomusaceae bacterium]|nr:HRDC domain-containing protein [Sporomusaceae bacterium]
QKKAPPAEPQTTELSGDSTFLFEKLRKLRRDLAFEQGVPPYIIFADSALKDMCHKLPYDMQTFGLVKGVGEVKAAKYGQIFLKTIQAARGTELGEENFKQL